MTKLLFYCLIISHFVFCEVSISADTSLKENYFSISSVTPSRTPLKPLGKSPTRSPGRMRHSPSSISPLKKRTLGLEAMDKENNDPRAIPGQVVVWSANEQASRDSLMDNVQIIPCTSKVMRLKKNVDALFEKHFPRSLEAQTRQALKAQLVEGVQELSKDPAARISLKPALLRGDFDDVIFQIVRDQALDKGTFDASYIADKIQETHANYPEKTHAAIKKAVVKKILETILNPDKLKKLFTEKVIKDIIIGTINETLNDVENIRSIAERRIQEAIKDKKFLIDDIETIISMDIFKSIVDRSLKTIPPDKSIRVNINAFEKVFFESLEKLPGFNQFCSVFHSQGLLKAAFQNLNHQLIVRHSDPVLVYPGSERGIFYFLVPNLSELTQFRGIQLPLGNNQNIEQEIFTRFVGNFNATIDNGATTIIRFVQLEEYLNDNVWDSIKRTQSLSQLLKFYEDNNQVFREVLREVSVSNTKEHENNIYAEFLTKKNIFSKILKRAYHTTLELRNKTLRSMNKQDIDTLKLINEVNASLFETLSAAYTIHKKCQIEEQENHFIAQILDAALIDSRDMIESIDYYFKDFNIPDPRFPVTTDENMVVVRFRQKGPNTVSQAFGAWADKSMFAMPHQPALHAQHQPALQDKSRKQSTKESARSCALM